MSNPYQPSLVKILDIERETYDTSTYTLAFTNPSEQEAYVFSPGQFNMLTLFGIGEAPISISSDPDEKNRFQHTIRHVGRVTNYLQRLKAGDTLWVRGPYGNGWPLEHMRGKNVIIVAGGIGLAPLRPVIYSLVNRPQDYGQVEILYGARTPADILFSRQSDQWQSGKMSFLETVDMVPAGQDWKHNIGVVTTLFDRMKIGPDNTVAITCGPEIMMRFVVKGLMNRGFDGSQIYVSMERRMSCGISKCGNCQIGSKFVCRDGPVFAYDELAVLAEPVLA